MLSPNLSNPDRLSPLVILEMALSVFDSTLMVRAIKKVNIPRITDAKTPIKDRVNHELLADLGLTGDETTAEVVDVLEKIHPLIRH